MNSHGIAFSVETRPSDSPGIEAIWRSRSEAGGWFTSLAESHWELVFTKTKGRLTCTVRGPETKALRLPVPDDSEFMGIVFKHGYFMPRLAVRDLVNTDLNLPDASALRFRLDGQAWSYPDFHNADTFGDRLLRQEVVICDPIVQATLQGQPGVVSPRSIQRRLLHATGLSLRTLRQIERARHALALLEGGASILDTIGLAGYFDQPHLTRSLKHFIGRTPAQIVSQSTG